MIRNLHILKNTSVGLDIGNGTVRVVVLEKLFNKFQVSGYGKENYPADSEEECSQAIKRLYDRMKITQAEVVTNYRGRDIQTRVMELPILPPQELNSRLRQEIKKLFSLSVDVSSWYMFYHIIKRTEKKFILTVSFCKPESIDRLVRCVEKAGLKPVIIGAEILDIFLGFSLDWEDLFEQKYCFINQNEGSLEYCLVEKGNPVHMESSDSLEVISDIIKTWKEQRSTTISKIIFTGHGFKNKNLDKIIIRGAEKKIGYPLESCSEEKIDPGYAAASGLAVKGFFPQLNTIDLLPESRKMHLSKQREKKKSQRIIIAAGLLLLIIVFLLQGYTFFLSRKLSELQQQKILLGKSITAVEEAERERHELQQIYYHIQQLSHKRSNFSELLYEISKCTPTLVWLYELISESDQYDEEKTGNNKVKKIIIRGLSYNEGKTAEFLQNLENLHLLHKVRLSDTRRLSDQEVWKKTKIRKIPLIQFTMQAEVYP
ncbi:MAG: pilus assembly protein PilM [bacterium]